MSGNIAPSSLPGADTVKTVISRAKTPNDVLNAAAADPQTEAILQQAFATVVQQYGHSPAACVVAYLLAWATQHYGFPSLDPVLTQIVSAIFAAAIGYIWQWASKKINAKPAI
jgi:hypothetical protein